MLIGVKFMGVTHMKRTLIAVMAVGLIIGPAWALKSLGTLTLTDVKARIFTPNGDGANDKARFEFDNPELLPVAGSIYDISGARVADLTPSTSSPTEVLLWDGKDSSGATVPGGIYVYQIDFQGEHATGTVIVSR
jgi:hypothetical protein